MTVFDLNPREYADKCSCDECVRIKNGGNPEFLVFAQKFTELALKSQGKTRIEEWRFAKKNPQFLFESPESADLKLNTKHVIGDITALSKNSATIQTVLQINNDACDTNTLLAING